MTGKLRQTQHRITKSLVDSGNRVLFVENTGQKHKIKDKNRIIGKLKLGESLQKALMKLKTFLYIPQ